MKDQIQKMGDEGVSQAEFDLALGNITGGLALRYESSIARMNRLLSSEIGTGEYVPVSELMQRFHGVSLDQIQQVAQTVFSRPSSLVAVGNKLSGLAL